MKTLFNQRGFSMVEVMVAMGMLGVLGYGLMKFTETSGLQQQKMTFNQGLNSFTNSIQTELAKKENCSASLMNLASGAHINEIKEGKVDPSPSNTTGAIIPTGRILMKKHNPLDNSGLFIDDMLYTQNQAGKDVLRVTFVAGSIDAAGNRKLKKLVGSSTLKRDFIINAIKDPSTNLIINCYSDFTNLANTLEQKICDVEKKLVNAVGGTTTNCIPNISVTRLHLLIHKDSDCTSSGGSVVTVEGNVNICRMNAASCPGGWTQYKGWSTTTNRVCSASLSRGNGVNGNAWGACSPNQALINKCGHGTSNNSGSHSWDNNNNIEQKSYETVMRICYALNCGDHICYDNDIGNTWVDCGYGGGGSSTQQCVATRTQIGCY